MYGCGFTLSHYIAKIYPVSLPCICPICRHHPPKKTLLKNNLCGYVVNKFKKNIIKKITFPTALLAKTLPFISAHGKIVWGQELAGRHLKTNHRTVCAAAHEVPEVG